VDFGAVPPAPGRAVSYLIEGSGWYRVLLSGGDLLTRLSWSRFRNDRESAARAALAERGRLLEMAAAGK